MSVSLPGWIYKKKSIVWLIIFLGIFVLANDWWNWNQETSVLFGLPFWIVRIFILTIGLSPLFWAFSRSAWRDE
jgi:hypothetical protein